MKGFSAEGILARRDGGAGWYEAGSVVRLHRQTGSDCSKRGLRMAEAFVVESNAEILRCVSRRVRSEANAKEKASAHFAQDDNVSYLAYAS
jgi:hypothetical protein